MEEQLHNSPEDSFTPSNVTSFAIKVVIESMKGSKNDRVRRWGETAGDVPKALARFGSKGLDKIFGSDHAPSADTLVEVADDLEKHPEEVVAAAGQVLITTIVDDEDAATRMHNDLERYATVMRYVCDFMQNEHSSVALLGFFQGDDCLSYWHLTGTPKVTVQNDAVMWTGFEVYLRWSESPIEEMVSCNEYIRDSRTLHQQPSFYDFHKDPSVAEVSLLRRATVSVRRLNLDGPRLFGGSSFPDSIDYLISVDGLSVLTMFESLCVAKDILYARSKGEGFAKAVKAINDEKTSSA